MITKTNFITYQFDTPLHLWAEKKGMIETAPSLFNLHKMEQGKEIEDLANEFLREYLATSDHELIPQKTFTDGDYQARVDVLTLDTNEQVYDIYEIKSSTAVSKDYIYDVAFQHVVCAASIPIRSVYLVLVNKEYVRTGELDISQLFFVEDLTEESNNLKDEVVSARESARQVAAQTSTEGLTNCLKPNSCPCPSLCHPELPAYPIYSIPRLHKNKAKDLIGSGILSIEDVPADYPLSDRQTPHVMAVQQEEPVIDLDAIKIELRKLEYPLYFLDYETYNPAVPLFDGYRPYQHIVFQYSLHVLSEQGSPPEHFECLITEGGDPGEKIVAHLTQHIDEEGSVIVWNKSFEAGRNSDMAEMYPEYADFLLGINDRIYDLMDCFSKGYYVHADFHGSASIKNVLPVVVDDSDLNYESLSISRGDEAMLAWANITSGLVPDEQLEQTRKDLLRYCELDTLAMVKIWEFLQAIVAASN